MSQDQPTDARARLLSHFSTAKGTTEHGQRWDALWADGFVPWDRGSPNPALVDFLTDRPDLIPQPNLPFLTKSRSAKKVLVPGCGKGYDVLLFAAFGYEAYGLEFSEKALGEARKVEKEEMGKGIYETKAEGGSVNWLSGDFFKDDFLKEIEGGKFDVIYDYTVCSSPIHREGS
jgi:SAM-dependent methyltransferase